MSDTLPIPAPGGGGGASVFAPLTQGGGFAQRARAFTAQPAVKKMLPWFAGVAAIGIAALAWATLSPAPQRTLYTSLDDSERAGVVEALDQAGIGYTIDNNSGALSVDEDDLYRARMLVASNGALATPQSGAQLIDSLPMGASRTLEGDRLRAAQERELELTIQEIDGVDAVRVHLARAERSVFVREDVAPSASVMVRMARGRQLSDSQVEAITNLVAASVPGLAVDAVRVVDQNGKLLTQDADPNAGLLDLQTRMEAKLHAQIDQLLAPMIGTGNFSSQVQVALDMNEVTRARESYDKDGVVRRESTQETRNAAAPAGGIPGATANTPPPDPATRDGAPRDSAPPAGDGGLDESSSSRLYELGREVSVSNMAPGAVKTVSVAVAIDKAALKGASGNDVKKIEALIAAAVGANPTRGDTVNVLVRPFDKEEIDAIPFYETGWFAMVVRNGVALLAVLLVLFFALRPAVKALRGPRAAAAEEDEDEGAPDAAGQAALPGGPGQLALPPQDRGRLNEQIELAQRIARETPDDAAAALRRMLAEGQIQRTPA